MKRHQSMKRIKALLIKLTPEEFEEIVKTAKELSLPKTVLVRSKFFEKIRGDSKK